MTKTIIRFLSGGLLLLTVSITALFLFHPRIPLGTLSGPVSSLLSLLTGNEQIIRGEYVLIPGAWTTLAVTNGSLDLVNKEEASLKTEIASARTTIHLWSLFAGKLNMDGLFVNGMTLELTQGRDPDPQAKKDKNGVAFPQGNAIGFMQSGPISLSDISATIIRPGSGSPLQYHLVNAEGKFSSETPGEIKVEAILDEKSFSASLKTGPLKNLATYNSNWPFSLHLNHKSMSAAMNGSVVTKENGAQLAANFSVSGEHFDDVVTIFGMHGSTNQPFTLQGTTTLSREELQAHFTTLQPGSEKLSLSVSLKDWGTKGHQLNIAAQGDHLDLDALKGFIDQQTPKQAAPKPNQDKAGINRDDILFPGTFPFRYVNINLDINKLVMAGKQIKGVKINAAMDDGIITNAPFAAIYPNFSSSGHFSLNLKRSVPEILIHLNSRSINVGAILKELQLADGFDMYIGNVKTDVKTKGTTLGEFFSNVVFTIKATDGSYTLQDPNTGAALPITLHETTITGTPGESLSFDVKGDIDETPIATLITFDDRRDEPPRSVTDVSFTSLTHVAGARWTLEGIVPLPYRQDGISVSSKFSGERFSDLNDLLNLKLPEIGPYELSGTLATIPEGYRLDDLHVMIGSSSLSGGVFLDTAKKPPLLDIKLLSKTIQLDDFEPLRVPSTESAADKKTKEMEKKASHKEDEKYLTDQSVLDSYDAMIKIAVEEVRSGKDFLGSGTLNIEQQKGEFKVSPLTLDLPQGNVAINYAFGPVPDGRQYTINIDVENLDYGFIARRVRPDADMSGVLNLRTSMESTSPDRKNIMKNGSGYFDFSVQPKQMQTGIIDLWAVNIFSHLLPFLAPNNDSTINCAAGRFNLKNGILNQEDFLIDTSRMRVNGNVEVDFHTNRIESRLRPVPKRPQFFSLATPIEISGNLSDLNVGVAAGGAVGTMIRLVTSYIVVPIQWLVLNKLPENGTPDCLQLVEERE